MSNSDISKLIVNLGDIGNKASSYVVSLAALATAIVQLAKVGGEAVSTLQGYLDEILAALSDLADRVRDGLDNSKDEVQKIQEKVELIFGEAFELLHSIGFIDQETYEAYQKEFLDLVKKSDELEAGI